MKKVQFIYIVLIVSLLSAFSVKAEVKRYKAEVVKEYSHDEKSFTQGLFFHDGVMYESTGMNGESTFRKVDLKTGKALRRLNFRNKYFVEGSVMLNGELFILTWQNKVAFVYDAATLKYKSSVSYPREGWGLTTDGKDLIASDGSSSLYFMDNRFNVLRSLNVTYNGRALYNLNELEYIDGKIWANVYLTDMIVIINPSDGNVEALIDCTGILPDTLRDNRTDVLNGIAYEPDTKKIYITGKYWKRLFEIRLKEN